MKALLSATLGVALLATPPATAQDRDAPSGSIHVAVFMGDSKTVRQHIEAGTDLNEPDAFGSSPLIIAATFDKTDIAEVLIKAGAELDARNNDGSTPLHIAAFFCHQEIVELLLEHGADRTLRNSFSNTALDSVSGPFEDVRTVYEAFGQALGPLGLDLDAERLKAARPRIAEMLRPDSHELKMVEYAPRAGGGWDVSTPAEQGLDPDLVAELYYDAAGLPKLYSVLVIKNGQLIAERYFNGSSVEHKARLQSVTKSYTSALTGIALERGHLSTVDQKMIGFFPEVLDRVSDPRKQQITIRHLLQMRAGYPWEETDPALWDGLLSGVYAPLIDEIPLLGDPGTQFNYSNLTSNWLGIIVARACGTNLDSFAREHLFTPLGVEPGDWGTDALGHNNGCGDLHMSARDMARFGLLYLNDGRFEGRQIVPAEWVEESLRDYSPDTWAGHDKARDVGRYFRDLGYGYQWWSAKVGAHDLDMALGHGGQQIILLDELDMVVVATSDPFYLVHNDEAWAHEQSVFNLVGKFIESLPRQ